MNTDLRVGGGFRDEKFLPKEATRAGQAKMNEAMKEKYVQLLLEWRTEDRDASADLTLLVTATDIASRSLLRCAACRPPVPH